MRRAASRRVASVEEGSPAARAGVKAEDVVVAVDGKAIGSSRELTRTIGSTDPGKSVTLTIYRNGDRRETKVELGARPGERTARGESRDATESLGLAVANVDPQTARQLGISPRGALVTAVRPGSPAEPSRAAWVPSDRCRETSAARLPARRRLIRGTRCVP
jgi:serine protease Do